MAKTPVTKNSIQKKYQDYLLMEGRAPSTVRIFTKYAQITDDEFFQLFGNLESIESSIWTDYYIKTFNVLQKDKDFEEMSGREKHLSFLFTLLEIIKSDRSYILYRTKPMLMDFKLSGPRFFAETRKIVFNHEINWVIPPAFVPEQGQDFAQSSYKAILWKHSLAMIHFWVKDDTPGAVDTDVFIEKSTRTLFDVGELPALDSIIDLGKFFLQKMGFTKATA
jgi:hypothetical protein